MDGQSAAIETALANAEPDAAMRKHLLGTQAQLDATKTLKQVAETHPNAQKAAPNAAENTTVVASGAKDSQQGSSPRSLVADNGNADRPTTAASQNQPQGQALAAAVAASTTDAGAQTETPDGLTLTPAQATAQANAAARAVAIAYQRPDPQINLPHIAVEIARHAQQGINRFDIRLNPAELGRIDVRLEMDQSGNVIARLAVERSETLDLLQRDQRTLEKALADAGLDGDKTDLEFSLKREGQDEPGHQRDEWRASGKATLAQPSETEAVSATGTLKGYARLDAVNLWV